MISRVKKIQIAVFVTTLVVLAAIWALNGYELTWLYVCLIPVIVPNPWWVELINAFSKKRKD